MREAAARVASTELPELKEFTLLVVAMSDDELLELNQTSLGHNWLTDVITFEIERSNESLEAEIYISVDRAKENAQRFKQDFELELVHLVVHGVLHLAGYDDKNEAKKKRMRIRERWYLAELRPS